MEQLMVESSLPFMNKNSRQAQVYEFGGSRLKQTRGKEWLPDAICHAFDSISLLTKVFEYTYIHTLRARAHLPLIEISIFSLGRKQGDGCSVLVVMGGGGHAFVYKCVKAGRRYRHSVCNPPCFLDFKIDRSFIKMKSFIEKWLF